MARHPAGPADLRGHLVRDRAQGADRPGRRDDDRHQRFALASHHRARTQDRLQALVRCLDRSARHGLRQPGRWPGRAGLRRRQLCLGRRGRDLPASARLRGSAGLRRMGAHLQGLARRWRRAGAQGHRAGSRLESHDAGPARLCRQGRLPRRGAGHVRRDRQRPLGRHRRRRAGTGAGLGSDDAVQLHVPGEPGGCPGLRRAAGRAL